MTDNNKPLPPAGRSCHPVTSPKSGEVPTSGRPAGRSTGHSSRDLVPQAVLSCGAADVALWLYAQGYDHYDVKTELRAYGFDDARYFADLMLDAPAGARQHAEIEAFRAGNAIAPDVPYADDPHAWHAVWSEETRSLVRTILRHRRLGNRDAAKAVRCLLPERFEWRRWNGTLTERDRRRIAEAETLAAAAREMIEQGAGIAVSEGADM